MKIVISGVLGLFVSACTSGSSPGTPTNPSTPPQPATISLSLNLALPGTTISVTGGPFYAGVPGYFTVNVMPGANPSTVRLALNPGDGAGDLTFDVGATAGEQKAAHVYNAPGLYTGAAAVTQRVSGGLATVSSSFYVKVY